MLCPAGERLREVWLQAHSECSLDTVLTAKGVDRQRLIEAVNRSQASAEYREAYRAYYAHLSTCGECKG